MTVAAVIAMRAMPPDDRPERGAAAVARSVVARALPDPKAGDLLEGAPEPPAPGLRGGSGMGGRSLTPMGGGPVPPGARRRGAAAGAGS